MREVGYKSYFYQSFCRGLYLILFLVFFHFQEIEVQVLSTLPDAKLGNSEC